MLNFELKELWKFRELQQDYDRMLPEDDEYPEEEIYEEYFEEFHYL